jgi:enoyl-CoA hydratase
VEQNDNTQPRQEVRTEVVDGVLVITINRPQARNAVNVAVAEQLAAAMDRLDGDDSLTVGIVTGAGGTFCSGMDLKAFAAGEVPRIPGRGFAGMCERPADKPLIAAVEGWALAGGCEVALACDLVVAATDAAFGIPEVKRGLVAGAGGLIRLPRRIPAGIAMELALTGDPLPAPRAHALGLVNVLSEPGQALAGALTLARRIAANGPLAVRTTKQIMLAQADWSAEERWTRQATFTEPIFTSADAVEGAKAFAEKRAPVWKQR